MNPPAIPENLASALERFQHIDKKLTAPDIAKIVSSLGGNMATDPLMPLILACSEDAEEGVADVFLGDFVAECDLNFKNLKQMCDQGGFARFGDTDEQVAAEERRRRKAALKEIRGEAEPETKASE